MRSVGLVLKPLEVLIVLPCIGSETQRSVSPSRFAARKSGGKAAITYRPLSSGTFNRVDDDTEQLIRLVGEAQPPDPNSDVMPVSVGSPMGDALMKARVGDTVKVKAPRGTMEFKILQIVQ